MILYALFALLLTAGTTFSDGRERPVADIAVHPEAGGARLVFTLSQPIERLDLRSGSELDRADWVAETPGVQVNGAIVTSEKPIRHFVIRLPAAQKETFAVYPAYSRVGSGALIYAPYFEAGEKHWQTRVRIIASRGSRVLGNTQDGGFVYVGPQSTIRSHGAFTLVTDGSTPPWLSARIDESVSSGLAWYRKALGVLPSRRPLVVVSHDMLPGESLRADVSAGGVISFRFHGGAWNTQAAHLSRGIDLLVLHEVFHLYNAGSAQPTGPAWLHEGGAEYAALSAAVALGRLSEREAGDAVTKAAEQCRIALGHDGLSQAMRPDAARNYACGLTAQWLFDLASRSDSSGGVLGAWAKLARQGGEYDLGRFLDGLGGGPRAYEPIRLLLNGGGADRWERLWAAAAANDASIVQGQGVATLHAALLRPVLDVVCRERGGSGFFSEPPTLRLDVNATCIGVPDDFVIAKVEEIPVFEAPERALDKARRACATAQTFRASGSGGEIDLRCPKAFGSPDAVWIKSRLRSR